MTETTIRAQMDAFNAYIPFIEARGMNPDVLNQIIKDHESIQKEVLQAQKRFEVSKDGVPILSRTPSLGAATGNENIQRIETIVNNKINNAFDDEIIGTKIGYTLGIPINYTVEKAREEARLQALSDEIDRFRIRDNVPDKDVTLGTRASVSGYGARLCYISVENNKPIVRIANLNPAECIFIYEESMAEPRYAVHYYSRARINDDGTKVTVKYAEFHSELTTQYYEAASGTYELIEEKLHGFNYCPSFGVENNDSLNNEVKKVLNLIDAYDRVLSDASNEIESMRLAYLVMRNIGMDEDDIEKLKQSGVFEMFGDDTDVRFLTKDINDTIIQNQLKTLEENINKFAKSVNFNDEAFGGSISGVAIRFKTMALEQKAIILEHKMRSALQYQFKVMCSAWAKLGICEPEDYLNIWFQFKRNLPTNILEEAQATVLFKGNVSEDTRLARLSFVDDVAAEKEAMQEDALTFGQQLTDVNDDDPIEINNNDPIETV